MYCGSFRDDQISPYTTDYYLFIYLFIFLGGGQKGGGTDLRRGGGLEDSITMIFSPSNEVKWGGGGAMGGP